MNIKSLLLGSAAALVAVSGARAADAVVIAEPEPMEYVRVCDTYGVGFYYIPGTETCLKVSGYIRYDIGVGARGIQDTVDKLDDAEDDVRTTTTTPTSSAPASSSASTAVPKPSSAPCAPTPRSTSSTTSRDDGETYTQDEFGIDHAYIELGGFRVGKTDSLFSTFTGYSSGVSTDGLVPYGPFGTHQIAYTFTGGNGFTAAVALEEGGGGEGSYDDYSYALDDYVPHVVGGVGWTGGWGGVSVVAGYDAVFDEGAVKGRVDFNVNDAISLFVMGAWASNDDSDWDQPFDRPDSQNYYAPWGGEWAVWVGGAWKVTEQATVQP